MREARNPHGSAPLFRSAPVVREKKELSFSDLVTADLEDRLAEKLKG